VPDRPHLLHVFSTFVPAGPQVRTASLLEAFGDAFRHSLVAMDGRLDARELVDDAVDVTYLDAPPKAGSLRTVPRMASLIRDARPDLVLTYNFGAIDTALALRTFRGPPLVHHEDGFRPDEASALKRRRSWLRRAALARAAAVVVISENLRRIALDAWRLDRDRVHFIPNGIEAERFEPADGNPALRAELGIPADAFVVGAVGHLRPEKNVARLLRAAARVEGAHVLVLGEGPEREALEAVAASRELAGRVHFAGYHADPRGHYRAMDAFALSSDTEQMPIALLEAMATSLPVAATDVGDVRAILPDAQAEFVVPLGERCLEGLSHALGRLAAAPDTRARLAAANRERILKRFTKQRMVAAYRELYERALGA
jgi:glycosyltransferase involved in cell wall biosynthesis